jgi:hypothetical protein
VEFDQGVLVYRPKISSDKYEGSGTHGQSCAEADLRQHPHPPSKVCLSVIGVTVYLLSFCVRSFSLIW